MPRFPFAASLTPFFDGDPTGCHALACGCAAFFTVIHQQLHKFIACCIACRFGAKGFFCLRAVLCNRCEGGQ